MLYSSIQQNQKLEADLQDPFQEQLFPQLLVLIRFQVFDLLYTTCCHFSWANGEVTFCSSKYITSINFQINLQSTKAKRLKDYSKGLDGRKLRRRDSASKMAAAFRKVPRGHVERVWEKEEGSARGCESERGETKVEWLSNSEDHGKVKGGGPLT